LLSLLLPATLLQPAIMMRTQVVSTLLRSRPVLVSRVAPGLARSYSSTHHEETFESFTERYVNFFQSAEDLFEVQRGLNNCFAHDLVPAPTVVAIVVAAVASNPPSASHHAHTSRFYSPSFPPCTRLPRGT